MILTPLTMQTVWFTCPLFYYFQVTILTLLHPFHHSRYYLPFIHSLSYPVTGHVLHYLLSQPFLPAHALSASSILKIMHIHWLHGVHVSYTCSSSIYAKDACTCSLYIFFLQMSEYNMKVAAEELVKSDKVISQMLSISYLLNTTDDLLKSQISLA